MYLVRARRCGRAICRWIHAWVPRVEAGIGGGWVGGGREAPHRRVHQMPHRHVRSEPEPRVEVPRACLHALCHYDHDPVHDPVEG